MDVGQGGEIRRHGGGIEQAGLARLKFGNLVHDYPIAEAGPGVTAAAVRCTRLCPGWAAPRARFCT